MILNRAIKIFIATFVLSIFFNRLVFCSYSLYIGTFDKNEAESLYRHLVSRGYPVYLLYGETQEVRMGNYETLDNAENALEKLKSEEKIVARIIEEEYIDQLQFNPKSEEKVKEVNAETAKKYTDPRAQKIISLTLDLFGHPYQYGGNVIGKGIDCSFFVMTIFKELGINLPRTSRLQYKVGDSVKKTELKVGDLVFFKKTYYYRTRKGSTKRRRVTRINHVGIYIGNDEFIHATRNVMRVTISNLQEKYFKKRYAGARRVLKESDSKQAANK